MTNPLREPFLVRQRFGIRREYVPGDDGWLYLTDTRTPLRDGVVLACGVVAGLLLACGLFVARNWGDVCKGWNR